MVMMPRCMSIESLNPSSAPCSFHFARWSWAEPRERFMRYWKDLHRRRGVAFLGAAGTEAAAGGGRWEHRGRQHCSHLVGRRGGGDWDLAKNPLRGEVSCSIRVGVTCWVGGLAENLGGEYPEYLLHTYLKAPSGPLRVHRGWPCKVWRSLTAAYMHACSAHAGRAGHALKFRATVGNQPV